MENKIHNTFVHDKVIFDSLNTGLSNLGKIRYSKLPWTKEERACPVTQFNEKILKDVLEQGRNKVQKWTKINAGQLIIETPPDQDSEQTPEEKLQ